MSEQLTFNVDVNTAPMTSSVKQATQQVKTEFKNMYSQVKSDLAPPVQMSIDLKGDRATAKYRQLTQEVKNAKEAQHKLNVEATKARKSLEIQRQLSGGFKVTTRQLEKAKGALQRMLRGLDQNSTAAKRLQGELGKINQRMAQMKPPQGVGNFFGGLGGKLTLAGTAANLLAAGITKAVQAVGGFAQTGAGIEVLKLQLEAFTGSSEKAEQVYSEFLGIAAKTPFNLEQVAQAGRTMLAFGVETDKAVRITEQLGVVAGSTGGDLNNLARNMGQISAQGQAYTRDLTQFAMQGIPIWEEMSRVTGASVSELKKMAAEGQISFEIVEQALSNMTAEGTAFQRIGEEIGDTWIGKFRQLESGVQAFAGAMVEAVTNLDNALGGALKGSLQAIADGFKAAAENGNEFVAAMVGIGLGLTAIGIGAFVQQILNGYIPALRTLVKIKKTWISITKTLTAVQIGLKAMMGPAGWASIAIGVGVAAAAYAGLSTAMNAAEEETKKLKEEQKKAMGQSQETSTALGMTYEAAMNKYKGATQEAIDELKRLEAEKADLLQAQVQINQKYAEQKAAAQTAFSAIKNTYNQEKNAINDIIRGLERKKKSLQVMSPAQRKLAELSEKELRYTARTGEQLKDHISDKKRAKLEAQAQLDAIRQQKEQAKIQQRIDIERERLLGLQLQYAKDKQAHDERMAELAADQKTELEGIKNALDGSKTAIEELVSSIKGEDVAEALDKSQEAAGKIGPNLEGAKKPMDEAATSAGTLATNLGTATTNAKNLATAMSKIPKAPAGGGGLEPRFAGGSVSGGTTYTVNELGKEAFLSASGKLSMINAPAWGQWKAPSAGTVIPAHLTKQLDIPSGGISLSNSAGQVAARRGSVSGAMSAIRAGDNVVNNVTIQSSNPRQQAMDTMVQLARLKRARYS